MIRLILTTRASKQEVGWIVIVIDIPIDLSITQHNTQHSIR